MQAHYTYGSGLSILGRPDEAFQQLQQAAQLGFKDADQLATDEDFKPLRSDPRFPNYWQAFVSKRSLQRLERDGDRAALGNAARFPLSPRTATAGFP